MLPLRLAVVGSVHYIKIGYGRLSPQWHNAIVAAGGAIILIGTAGCGFYGLTHNSSNHNRACLIDPDSAFHIFMFRTREVLREGERGEGGNTRIKKVCFYIAQYPVRWTAQSALHSPPPGRPVHSDTNSASLGSRLAMQQLRATSNISTAVYSQALIYTAEWTEAL